MSPVVASLTFFIALLAAGMFPASDRSGGYFEGRTMGGAWAQQAGSGNGTTNDATTVSTTAATTAGPMPTAPTTAAPASTTAMPPITTTTMLVVLPTNATGLPTNGTAARLSTTTGTPGATTAPPTSTFQAVFASAAVVPTAAQLSSLLQALVASLSSAYGNVTLNVTIATTTVDAASGHVTVVFSFTASNSALQGPIAALLDAAPPAMAATALGASSFSPVYATTTAPAPAPVLSMTYIIIIAVGGALLVIALVAFVCKFRSSSEKMAYEGSRNRGRYERELLQYPQVPGSQSF